LYQDRYNCDAESTVQPAQVVAKKVTAKAKHAQQASKDTRSVQSSIKPNQSSGCEKGINATGQRDNQQENYSESHRLFLK
jgi:hypothetical protein